MFNIDFAKTNKKQFLLRLFIFVVCILFIAGSLLSIAFIIVRTSHDHDHIGPKGCCNTCIQLVVVEKFLKIISATVISAAAAFGCLFATQRILKYISLKRHTYTLVHLKVQFNN